jgi:hypothetical protein
MSLGKQKTTGQKNTSMSWILVEKIVTGKDFTTLTRKFPVDFHYQQSTKFGNQWDLTANPQHM